MIDETLQKLIEAISKIAPEVWKIMVRQAVVDGLLYAIWSIPVLIIAILIFVWMKKNWTAWRADDDGDSEIWSVVLLVMIIAVFLAIAGGAMARLVNPDYYAIRGLLYLIK